MQRQRMADRTVHALAFDIANPKTPLPEKLLVDTNIWLFTQYAGFGERPEANLYADFFKRCFDEECKLVRSAFSLPEIAHVIEGEELKLFNQKQRTNFDRKDARYITLFRRPTTTQVLTTWGAVDKYSEPSPGIQVSDETVKDIKSRFGQYKLDGYDLFLLQEARESGLTSILTHDFDYMSVPDLRIYTGHKDALAAAEKCGKLRS